LVESLQASPCQRDTSQQAFELIRGLIDAIVLTPVDGKLQIELRGDLAMILAMSEAKQPSAFSPKEKAVQIAVVAGRGFEPLTFRL
jgi:hypothetical protein